MRHANLHQQYRETWERFLAETDPRKRAELRAEAARLNRKITRGQRGEGELALILLAVVVLGGGSVGACYGCPQYKVYEQRLEGEAELAKAEYSKKVAVQEANAKQESAKALAQAEIERAKGVAEANRIIADSLKGNDAYLRYLWIQTLEHGGNDVIYVPTEANLPILEAGRAHLSPVPTADPHGAK